MRTPQVPAPWSPHGNPEHPTRKAGTYAGRVWEALARDGYRYRDGFMGKGPNLYPVPANEQHDAARASSEAAREPATMPTDPGALFEGVERKGSEAPPAGARASTGALFVGLGDDPGQALLPGVE